jgi:hypothetical protein
VQFVLLLNLVILNFADTTFKYEENETFATFVFLRKIFLVSAELWRNVRPFELVVDLMTLYFGRYITLIFP